MKIFRLELHLLPTFLYNVLYSSVRLSIHFPLYPLHIILILQVHPSVSLKAIWEKNQDRVPTVDNKSILNIYKWRLAV